MEVKKEENFKQMLKNELKGEGLDIVEDAVKSGIRVFFKILPLAIKLIKNPAISAVVGLLAGSILSLEATALKWADGIDGEIG